MTGYSMPQRDSVASRLAEKICGFGRPNWTPRALLQARTSIIDTVGVTLAGMGEACARLLLETPGVAEAPGASLIFGTDRRTGALDAALVNGTASHALDYDDVSGVMGGHPSAPLVAPLFALAEARNISGERLISAYMVGVETEIRLARAVHHHHYDKGWHPTSTLGTFGAAAAASYLIGLDAQRTAIALAVAASLAAGLKANFGTMTKPLHIGQCGRNGLFAALLAERGFDANPDVFEHRQGFFNVFNGPGEFDAERALANWGEPLEIEADSIGLKQFPCCGSTHPAIAMMLDLVREEGFGPDDVAHIEILAHPRRLPHTDDPDPRSPLAAKFSIQYVTARALVSGAVRLEHFERDACLDPAIRRVLALTEARPHPDMPGQAPKQWGAEVVVTLEDGRRLSRRVDEMVGRGGNPMTAGELWEKFRDCAERALPREQVAPLFDRLETLECVPDIGHVARLLEVRALPAAKPARMKVAASDPAPETTWVP